MWNAWEHRGTDDERSGTAACCNCDWRCGSFKGKIDFYTLSKKPSFFWEMIEVRKDGGSGVDLRYIQELLGHKSSKTTEIYTHVSNKDLSKIKSPLDTIRKEVKNDQRFGSSRVVDNRSTSD